MRSYDAASLTPDQRLAELAAILAAGLLRLHARAALSATDPGRQKAKNSAPPGLDVSGKTVLSVHDG